MKVIEKINLWRAISRDYTLPQTVFTYMFAVVIAMKTVQVNWFLSFLGLIGALFAHMSVNILDDYFDWKSGAVAEYKKLAEAGEQIKTHKCFYLSKNLTSHKSLLIVALSMDFIAVLLGLYIASKIGFVVLIIAALAAFFGFFYSAPPFKFSYNGMSELIIGLVYGPLLISGAYVTAGGELNLTVLFASIIVGVFVANISFVHCIMDFKSDFQAGKKSLATIAGSVNNAVILLAVFYVMAYLLVCVGVFLNLFPVQVLFVLLLVPKNIALLKMMKNNDCKKHFWMGYLENWNHVLKDGAEWFMLRLCLSRNLTLDFLFIFGLAYCLFS